MNFENIIFSKVDVRKYNIGLNFRFIDMAEFPNLGKHCSLEGCKQIGKYIFYFEDMY